VLDLLLCVGFLSELISKGVEPFSSLMMDPLVCVYIHTTVTRDKGGSFPKEIERYGRQETPVVAV